LFNRALKHKIHIGNEYHNDDGLTPVYLPESFNFIIDCIYKDIKAVNDGTSKERYKKQNAQLKESIEVLEKIQNNPYLSLITKPMIAKKMLQYNKEYYEKRSLYTLTENILIYRNLHWLGREMQKYSYSIEERDNAVFEIFKNAKYKNYATASVLTKQKIVHSLMNKIMNAKTL